MKSIRSETLPLPADGKLSYEVGVLSILLIRSLFIIRFVKYSTFDCNEDISVLFRLKGSC